MRSQGCSRGNACRDGSAPSRSLRECARWSLGLIARCSSCCTVGGGRRAWRSAGKGSGVCGAAWRAGRQGDAARGGRAGRGYPCVGSSARAHMRRGTGTGIHLYGSTQHPVLSRSVGGSRSPSKCRRWTKKRPLDLQRLTASEEKVRRKIASGGAVTAPPGRRTTTGHEDFVPCAVSHVAARLAARAGCTVARLRRGHPLQRRACSGGVGPPRPSPRASRGRFPGGPGQHAHSSMPVCAMRTRVCIDDRGGAGVTGRRQSGRGRSGRSAPRGADTEPAGPRPRRRPPALARHKTPSRFRRFF